jgi:hypothetical protein
MNNTKQYETIRKIYEIHTNWFSKIWKTCETEILFSKFFVLLTIPQSLLGFLAHRPPIRLVLCAQPLSIAYRHWPWHSTAEPPHPHVYFIRTASVTTSRTRLSVRPWCSWLDFSNPWGAVGRELPSGFPQCPSLGELALFFETLLVVDLFQDMLHYWMVGTEPRACRKNSCSWSQH